MLRLRAAIVFTILATLVAVMSAQLRHPATGIDDADIFLVYGRNLAQGYGLVYNPGGERVEGFTSPLWMLANAIAFRVTSQPESLLLLTNVVLVSIGVALLWAHVDRGRRVTVAGVAVVLWTLSSPSFVGWTTLTLMDTGPWSFALCLGAVIALSGRSAWRLAVVVPLLVLARPEGVVWAPIFIVLFLLLSTRQDAPTTPWRAVGISLFTY